MCAVLPVVAGETAALSFLFSELEDKNDNFLNFEEESLGVIGGSPEMAVVKGNTDDEDECAIGAVATGGANVV